MLPLLAAFQSVTDCFPLFLFIYGRTREVKDIAWYATNTADLNHSSDPFHQHSSRESIARSRRRFDRRWLAVSGFCAFRRRWLTRVLLGVKTTAKPRSRVDDSTNRARPVYFRTKISCQLPACGRDRCRPAFRWLYSPTFPSQSRHQKLPTICSSLYAYRSRDATVSPRTTSNHLHPSPTQQPTAHGKTSSTAGLKKSTAVKYVSGRCKECKPHSYTNHHPQPASEQKKNKNLTIPCYLSPQTNRPPPPLPAMPNLPLPLHRFPLRRLLRHPYPHRLHPVHPRLRPVHHPR